MKEELNFCLKVLRNGLVLTGMYFVSVWATVPMNWMMFKPLLIFLLTYITGELAVRYNLKPNFPNNKKGAKTLIF